MSGRTILLILVGATIVACVCAAIGGALLFGGVLAATQPAADRAEAFMAALRDGDGDAAYAMLSPAARREVGSASNLIAALRSRDALPRSWSFNQRNVQNDTATIRGQATFASGARGDIVVELIQTGGAWQVSGYTTGGR